MAKTPTVSSIDEEMAYIKEATQTVEDQLKLEDAGWVLLGGTSADVITDAARIANLRTSRLYYTKDPLGRQSIRLWTDYTFGTGMTWQAEEKSNTNKVLGAFWNSPGNQAVLGVRGQRKSSDKLLVDGEIFFALFLDSQGAARIRRIDPLEITEIITDSDDIENVLYYKRVWVDQQGGAHTTYYRSTTNIKSEPAKDVAGTAIKQNDDALVYHLTHRTLGQRGTPLSFPAHFYLKYNKKFIASRIAIMLALKNDAVVSIPGKKGDVNVDIAKVASSKNVFGTFIDYVDRLITKTVLGQELMTEMPGIGSYAAAQVHQSVFGLINTRDKTQIKDSMNRSLITYDAQLNTPSLAEEYIPEFGFKKSSIEDTAGFLQTVLLATKLGIAVSEDQVREFTGLRAPAEGEAVVTPLQDMNEEGMTNENEPSNNARSRQRQEQQRTRQSQQRQSQRR